MPGGPQRGRSEGGPRGVRFDEAELEEHRAAVARGEYATMRVREPKTPYAPPDPADRVEEPGPAPALPPVVPAFAGPGAAAAAAAAEADEEGGGGEAGGGRAAAAGLGLGFGFGSGGEEGGEGGVGAAAREAIKSELFKAKRREFYDMKGALRHGRQLAEEDPDDDPGDAGAAEDRTP